MEICAMIWSSSLGILWYKPFYSSWEGSFLHILGLQQLFLMIISAEQFSVETNILKCWISVDRFNILWNKQENVKLVETI